MYYGSSCLYCELDWGALWVPPLKGVHHAARRGVFRKGVLVHIPREEGGQVEALRHGTEGQEGNYTYVVKERGTCAG